MTTAADYQAAEQLLRRLAAPGELVVGDKVRPQWIEDGRRFWYQVRDGDTRQFVVVDPAAGTRTPDFDPMPFIAAPGNPLEVASPDGEVAVSRRGQDLWARCGEREWALTTDGEQDYGYGYGPDVLSYSTLMRKFGLPHMPPALAWSPDSAKVLAHRTDQREVRQTHLIESRPAGGGVPVTHTQRFAYPGDADLPFAELVVFDIAAGKTVHAQCDPLLMPELSPIAAGWAWWSADSSTVYFLSRPRDQHTLTLNRMDASSGEVSVVLSETGTNRVGPNQLIYGMPLVRVLADEVLWFSQRDGWGHLYRYDLHTGALLGQVTTGQWLVREVLHVDETNRLVSFTASGLVAEDPYRRTVCRIGLDGTGFTVVTDDSLDHVVTVAPNGGYFVDSASTVDTPPVTTVRSWTGEVLVSLEEADISRMIATGWTAPERFRVKAADGTTDIYGVLYKPRDFDPTQSYAVVDSVYPGPQVTRVEPCFDPGGMGMDGEPLAAVGFVVVALDGRGTPGRSKAFHDASYGRLADAGSLEDHVAALHQLAESRPWMDLSRVGVMGHSGGGFAAARAMLDFPEIFKAGVALSGSHDATCIAQGWAETVDGPDNPEAWTRASNVLIADRLKGKLLLVHGELDDTVHPDQSLRLADALIAAGKDFELLIVPGAEHLLLDRLAYVRTRAWDFLVRTLMGVEPPAYRPAPIVIDPEVLGEML
ncbi:S9 family peptidase [Lentzea flaviverrucosa]|uniref:Dipeptidyl aminopeptidase/acylaminoacyl peptidase n=1 Tax=Lentzea flaviverrucosa TaxID=200379 RepID=A0A1H9WZQ3_9PSEU|nr:DPP IV N-terminal domain-containing protein [Lentzea flaviverrucosa]RDI21026.1 dipeptidyl aminopeptidase/acylaminoacyl peptidase [Lentzea flaviverrucosa]SES39390.1 Dipeptidyl aminopeptidase/acylaminoacyl peptidase [Lentzea flaviverrucosa]